MGHDVYQSDASIPRKMRLVEVAVICWVSRDALLAGIGVLVLMAETSQAANNYGAIAYSFENGASGYSYEYRSRRAAEAVALRNCRRGGEDCRIIVWFRNGCAALAVGSNGHGYAWTSSRRSAERNALRKCRGYTDECQVIVWACTTR